jgi:hypothetical protein
VRAKMDDRPVCKIPRAKLQRRPVYKVSRAEVGKWCGGLCAPTTEFRWGLQSVYGSVY